MNGKSFYVHMAESVLQYLTEDCGWSPNRAAAATAAEIAAQCKGTFLELVTSTDCASAAGVRAAMIQMAGAQ